jgi:hypothetical protein
VIGRVEAVIHSAVEIHSECLKDDAQIESDLLACRAKVSYILPGEDIVFVDRLVERRLGEVRDSSNLPLQDADTAQDLARTALVAGDTREAFQCFCDAYQRLVLPESELPRVDCVEQPGSQNPNKP